jgi:hypothetical protein
LLAEDACFLVLGSFLTLLLLPFSAVRDLAVSRCSENPFGQSDECTMWLGYFEPENLGGKRNERGGMLWRSYNLNLIYLIMSFRV